MKGRIRRDGKRNKAQQAVIRVGFDPVDRRTGSNDKPFDAQHATMKVHQQIVIVGSVILGTLTSILGWLREAVRDRSDTLSDLTRPESFVRTTLWSPPNGVDAAGGVSARARILPLVAVDGDRASLWTNHMMWNQLSKSELRILLGDAWRSRLMRNR